MKNHHLHRLAGLAFAGSIAAAASGCGGGAGGTAPSALTPAAVHTAPPTTTTSALTPHVNVTPLPTPRPGATVPPGSAVVTLTIKVPPRKPATGRRAQFVQSQTTGVSALVSWTNGGPQTYPASGPCSAPSCTLAVPIPIAYDSTLTLQLLNGENVIGTVATPLTTTAGTITEGGTYAPTITLLPLIAQVLIDGGGATFYQGTSVPSFNVTVRLYDAAGDEILNDNDGVLDSNGNSLTSISLTQLHGVSGVPSTVSVATVPAGGIVLSNLSWDGVSGEPDVQPTAASNSISSSVALAASNTISYFTHGFNVTAPSSQYWNGFAAEYPAPSTNPSPNPDTFTFSENIPSDASTVTVFLDTVNEVANGSSNCQAIADPSTFGTPSFDSAAGLYYVTVPLSSGFNFYYKTGVTNGLCSLEFADGNDVIGGVYGFYQDAQIGINNPTLIIQGKKRK